MSLASVFAVNAFFPVPTLITHAPPLIGYYRMLLGLSKKEFGQSNRLGYGAWVTAEESGRIPPRLLPSLDQFCTALITPLAEVVLAIGPFSDRDLSDITLLTLGSTLQGGRNNTIGSHAAAGVFVALNAALAPYISTRSERTLSLTLPSGAAVEVVMGSDPDVVIVGTSLQPFQPLIAIEIKGGADASNAHNRAGEAEKFHLKAISQGFPHRWTLIRLQGVERSRIQTATPSSTQVFELAEILATSGPDWLRFVLSLQQILLSHELSTP